jgi:WD40 repeat protein
VTVAFDAWNAGHVAPSHHEIPIAAAKAGPQLEPVSPRLKGELIHPNRTSALVGARFSPDGKRILAGDYPGGVVVAWDVASGKQLVAIETGSGLRASYNYFFLTPDWRTLLVSQTKSKFERVEHGAKERYRWHFLGGVQTWDLATGRPGRTFQYEPARRIRLMQLSPDGTRLVTFEELPGTYEGRPKAAVSLWDVKTGQARSLPDDLQSPASFSPDGRALALSAVNDKGFAHGLKIFETATGREKLSVPIRDRNTSVYLSTFSADGRLVLGSYQPGSDEARKGGPWKEWVKGWDTTTGQEVVSFAGGTNEGFARPACSPDGRLLAVASFPGQQVKLWLFDMAERRLVQKLPLAKAAEAERIITSPPVFSPDGKWLAITTQKLPTSTAHDLPVEDLPQPRIHLIDVAAGAIRETLVAPQCYAHAACCFSPDGRTLATGGLGRILLWDLSGERGASAP